MKIIQILNRILRRKPRLPKKRSYFYISEAAKTPFELFKKMASIRQTSPKMARIFDNGNDAHKRYVGYLEKAGYVEGKEVSVKNKLFSGRADAIINIDGKLYVLEIKSMSSKSFAKIKKYGTRAAYLQLQLYLHYLKIDHGIILIIRNDDQKLKAFHIKRKYQVAQELIQKFYKLKYKFVQAGVMEK
jgi:hypothetical protein